MTGLTLLSIQEPLLEGYSDGSMLEGFREFSTWHIARLSPLLTGTAVRRPRIRLAHKQEAGRGTSLYKAYIYMMTHRGRSADSAYCTLT